MATTRTELPSELETRLDEAVRRTIELANPQLVILFGSYAEGDANEGSDLDLLVVAETESWHQLTIVLRRALRPVLAPMRFDLLVYPPESWERDRRVPGLVAREADRKGIRLYDVA